MEGRRFSSKDFLVIFIMLFNAASWVYLVRLLIGRYLATLNASAYQTTITWTVFYISILLACIAGALVSYTIRRLQFISAWVAISALVMLLPLMVGKVVLDDMVVYSSVWGTAIGIGLPTCLAYFANTTTEENRGRIGGIISFITYTVIASPKFIPQLSLVTNMMMSSEILALWRFSALVFVLFKPEEVVPLKLRRPIAISSIFRWRSPIFYFIPWAIFCLVSQLDDPLLKAFLVGVPEFMGILSSIIFGLFMLVGGFMCDLIGRKPAATLCFALLGFRYAFLGLYPTMLYAKAFFVIVDQIVLGIFVVLFGLTLWADLAPAGGGERFYMTGMLPVLLALVLEINLAPYLGYFSVSNAFLFAFVSIALAVFLTLLAPETLPETVRERRKIEDYYKTVERVKLEEGS